MPKLLPFLLVGGLPRTGKSLFISRVRREIPKVKVFREEDYVREANPYNWYYNAEKTIEPVGNREYALNYNENAKFLVEQAMLKDIITAAYYRYPIIAESNFFSLPKYRKMFREALTRDHLPMYTELHINDKMRNSNKPLDKYLLSDDKFFKNNRRRIKLGEGYVPQTATEVLNYIHGNQTR